MTKSAIAPDLALIYEGALRSKRMGKRHVDHRVVAREGEEIVATEDFPDFAAAKVAYDQLLAELPAGRSLALQHGARIIFKSDEGRSRPKP